MDIAPAPLAYRINDTCRILSIGRSTLYGLIGKKKLKPIVIGGRTLIPKAEIERLIAEGSRDG